MINFFIKSGDPQVSEQFTPYLWGANGLSKFVDIYANTIDYGIGLHLLLVQVYVEGRFDIYGPEAITVGNYSKTRKETSVAFTVRKADFQDTNKDERKKFLINMLAEAVDQVFVKHGKKMPDFNFSMLKENVALASQEYLKSSL